MILDPFHLQRFVDAQAEDYEVAFAELRAGEKRSHWMWYIFPRLDRPGNSSMARHFAIKTSDEARAYLKHRVLGPRLRDCSRELLAHRGLSALDILGSPDDLNLLSSATLFALASRERVFREILSRFFKG